MTAVTPSRPDTDQLRQLAWRGAGTASRRVYPIEHGSCQFMVKQAAPGRGRFRALGGALLVRILSGHWPPLQPLRLGGASQLHYEADRLNRLHRAGERVPEVLVASDEHLVMEDVGPPLTRVMRSLSPLGQAELACRAAGELADFHRRGQWHGGAQLRNHTMHHDKALYRIDFEEPLDQLLSLEARQAMDVMLMVHSATAIKAFTGEEQQRLGCAMVDSYLARNPPPESLAVIRQGHVFKRRLQRALGWARRWTGKDLRRIWITADVLTAVLPRLNHQS